MVLNIPIIYTPPFKEIEKESNLITLLEDVRKDLDNLSSLKTSKLSYALDLIDKGIFDDNIMIGIGNVKYVVDLSRAQNLVNSYRFKSEGGCGSCEEFLSSNETPGEYGCNLYDSQKVQEYLDKGCGDRKPIFRPIDEVLREVEEF